MTQMTFHEYIKIARITDTPQGDFVSDAKRDDELEDIKTWPELRRHLVNRGACPEAVRAGYKVFHNYRMYVVRTTGAWSANG
jgi:hypothetical protein